MAVLPHAVRRVGRTILQAHPPVSLQVPVRGGVSPYFRCEAAWFLFRVPRLSTGGPNADKTASEETALEARQKGASRRITVGADKAYDTKDFVTAARALNVDPAHNEEREGTPLEHGSQNHPASRLCDQPEPAMVS